MDRQSGKNPRGSMIGTAHLCPVCSKTMFPYEASFLICDVCGWQDDLFEEDGVLVETMANEMDLAAYRRAYEAGWRPDWVDVPGEPSPDSE